MAERPHVICLMTSSIDGGLHPSRYTKSPDGTAKDWSGLYEGLHGQLGGDGWIVGWVTMAEMAKGEPHPPAEVGRVERPCHFARRDASQYAVALDGGGKLHFKGPDIGGDAVVVLLGPDVSDVHLAELMGDGVSYIVSDSAGIDLPHALALLRSELGIQRLLLEGGAGIVGSFLAEGLVDELHIVVAPALDGRPDIQTIVSSDDAAFADVRLSLRDCVRLDHGAVHLQYEVATA